MGIGGRVVVECVIGTDGYERVINAVDIARGTGVDVVGLVPREGPAVPTRTR
jgi:hypothetical protein